MQSKIPAPTICDSADRLQEAKQELSEAYEQYNKAREAIARLRKEIQELEEGEKVEKTQSVARYAYRCYSRSGKALGWLYTYGQNEITSSEVDFEWFKQWKTRTGATRSFEHYNSRWRMQSGGGHLQIELLVYDRKIRS